MKSIINLQIIICIVTSISNLNAMEIVEKADEIAANQSNSSPFLSLASTGSSKQSLRNCGSSGNDSSSRPNSTSMSNIYPSPEPCYDYELGNNNKNELLKKYTYDKPVRLVWTRDGYKLEFLLKNNKKLINISADLMRPIDNYYGQEVVGLQIDRIDDQGEKESIMLAKVDISSVVPKHDKTVYELSCDTYDDDKSFYDIKEILLLEDQINSSTKSDDADGQNKENQKELEASLIKCKGGYSIQLHTEIDDAVIILPTEYQIGVGEENRVNGVALCYEDVACIINYLHIGQRQFSYSDQGANQVQISKNQYGQLVKQGYQFKKVEKPVVITSGEQAPSWFNNQYFIGAGIALSIAAIIAFCHQRGWLPEGVSKMISSNLGRAA